MRAISLEFVKSQSQVGTGQIHAAVRDATEVGVVVPSILEKNLTDYGFAIVKDDAALADYGFATTKFLKRVIVNDGAGNLIAMGAAGDHGEALLHAVLGYFRENPVGDEVAPAGIMAIPVPE